MITTEEYIGRVENIRQEMVKEEFDALLVYSWKRGQVKYVSGYKPNYIANVAMVMIPNSGDLSMWIRFPFDLERARHESWIEDIAASGDVMGLAQDSVLKLKNMGLGEGKIGIVSGDDMMDEMPYSVYQYILNELKNGVVVNANHIFRKLRLIKSGWEVEMLRESAKIADLAADTAARLAKPGASEFEVVSEAEAVMRRNEVDSHLVVIASKGATELIRPPVKGKYLEESDNVIFEVAAEMAGYWTQVARVFYVGGSTQAQRDIYQAVYRAYQQTAAALKPGRSCSDVAEIARLSLQESGFGNYTEQDFGHGIGLDLPELPRIKAQDQTILEPGMVIVVHPAVRVPAVGGAFLGGTVLVSDDGPELLHSIAENPLN